MVNETMSTAEKLAEALEELLKRDQRNTCQHDETHRGGAIWTICDGCGRKWADDEGGKPRWKDPIEWANAEKVLAEYRAQPAADGAQRVERMSKDDVLKLWDKYASVTNAYEDNGVGFARMLAAAWGVKLDGEGG